MKVVASTLALIAAVVLATSANAAILAVQDDRLPNLAGAALDQRLDLLAASGTTVTRVDIIWNRVAPTQPTHGSDPADPAYDWSRYDQMITGLVARNITPMLSYYWTPEWASRAGTTNAAPRTADAAAFAAAIARRYNGTWPNGSGGTLPLVRRLEIWNEPNIATFWYPQCRRQGNRYVLSSARAYAALLTAAYAQVKAVSPSAIVTGGVTGPVGDSQCTTADASVGTLTFATELVRHKVPIDAWSMHLYPIGSPLTAYFVPSWKTLPQVTRLVDRLRPGAPIYVTETGYHTSYNRYHRYFVSETQQAAWLNETVTVAKRYPRVEVAMWFNLQDNPSWTGGLLRGNGTTKPAWSAFASAAMAGTRPTTWAP
ncbi:MAG: hypothetical protein EXQ74_03095 [Thermoleophilia bacterium]|nr:hypothetical protein [Thermoleophilia bacterium]